MSIYIDADAFARWEKGSFDLLAFMEARSDDHFAFPATVWQQLAFGIFAWSPQRAAKRKRSLSILGGLPVVPFTRAHAAAILKDLGFDTELTPATRDGGRDIYAYVRNAVTSFLMFVECKKWANHRKVGIEIVQRVHGAAKAGGAHKAMIVATSFFTLPAQQERHKIEKELDLVDYDKLKTWLARYK